MSDPRYAYPTSSTQHRPNQPSTFGFDDGGAAARAQSQELLAFGGSTGTSQATFADRAAGFEVDNVRFIPPSYLGTQSRETFRHLETTLRGADLLGPALVWAGVILAGLSTPEELAALGGVGLAHGSAPLGSEMEAVGAIRTVAQYKVDQIVGAQEGEVLNMTAQEIQYWKRLRSRLCSH